MSSQVVEELITRVGLDDRQFQQAAKNVIQTAQQVANALNMMTAAAQAANQQLGGVHFGGGNNFNFGGGGGPGGGGGAGGGTGGGGNANNGGFGFQIAGAYAFVQAVKTAENAIINADKELVSFGEDALKEFASFKTIELTFRGVYDSTAKAAQMMAYLRDTAKTSAFHFTDLANAARGLSAAGIDVGRFLPVVQGFALAKGDINGAGLQDMVALLRRIQGGNMGVAFGPRGVGRYGISQSELEHYGAKFDDHHHFTGTIDQAFDVVEQVFKGRIEKIATEVSKSPEVALSNLKDAWDQFTIEAGHGVADNMLDPLRQVTRALHGATDSGIARSLFDTLSSSVLDGLQRAFGLDFSGGSEAPRYDFKTKDERLAYEKERFKEDDPDHPRRPTSSGDKMTDTLIQIGGYMVTLVEFTKYIFLELQDSGRAIKDLLKEAALGPLAPYFNAQELSSPLAYAMDAGDAFVDEAHGRALADWKDKVNHPGKRKAPKSPTGNAIAGADDENAGEWWNPTAHDANNNADTEARQYLADIAHNTRQIHEHMQEHAFGGNDLGRIGVTPQELSTGTGGPMHQIINWHALESYIDAVFEERFAHRFRMSGHY